MFYTKKVLFFVAGFITLQLVAQNNLQGFGESSLDLNHKVNDDYTINFAVSSRYYLYQDHNVNFKNRQLDIVHFSTLNLNYNHRLSLGIQYRIRAPIDGDSNELRLAQQFNYTKKIRAVRFGHRARIEERIFDNFTIIRSRYRFALDFPLNGEKLNVGEKYLVCSMEALLSKTKEKKPELDHRTTALIGWFFSKKIKFQFGLEYRFEAFNIETDENFFILSSCILKI